MTTKITLSPKVKESTQYPPPPAQISTLPYGQLFPDKAILTQAYQMNPKWPTRKGQRYPIYILKLWPSPKFQSVSLCRQLFSCYRQIWDTCIKWPQSDLPTINGTRYIYMLNYPESQISLLSLYGQPFWVTCYLETSALNERKMTLST